ncbi:GNAT family N-acetyltransferase [Candidatus Pacearchaeota archaeon]|nr:GNAT family N-acetyltransferase [Candidatus Pacearchaeota archaeon]
MNLKGPGFLLRPPKKGDEASIAKHANDKDIWINLTDTFPHPYKRTDAKRWIKNCQDKREKGLSFVIVVDGKAVGGIGIKLNKGFHKGTAEIGYWLGRLYWGKGIMTHALRIITKYALKRFKLARIQACVFPYNPASARVLEKAGYQYEGRLRKNIIKDKKSVDELVYAQIR